MAASGLEILQLKPGLGAAHPPAAKHERKREEHSSNALQGRRKLKRRSKESAHFRRHAFSAFPCRRTLCISIAAAAFAAATAGAGAAAPRPGGRAAGSERKRLTSSAALAGGRQTCGAAERNRRSSGGASDAMDAATLRLALRHEYTRCDSAGARNRSASRQFNCKRPRTAAGGRGRSYSATQQRKHLYQTRSSDIRRSITAL